MEWPWSNILDDSWTLETDPEEKETSGESLTEIEHKLYVNFRFQELVAEHEKNSNV